jgi:hypothetical protein
MAKTPRAERISNAIRNTVGIAGACALTYGVHAIYAPAGWIVGGALAIAAAILDAMYG